MRKYCPRLLSVFTLVTCLAAAGATTLAVAADPPPTAAATVLKRGKLLFLQCTACHDITAAQPSSDAENLLRKVGPNLHGLMGRQAGTLASYSYSEALRKSGVTWTKPNLDRWLQQPAIMVPDTTMTFVGISSEADRTAVIAYLESATR